MENEIIEKIFLPGRFRGGMHGDLLNIDSIATKQWKVVTQLKYLLHHSGLKTKEY